MGEEILPFNTRVSWEVFNTIDRGKKMTRVRSLGSGIAEILI